MLLHDSRRAARTGPNGELVLLSKQDRRLWNQAQIAEGTALTQRALRLPRVGSYGLQAAIAAVHAEAKTATETDWPQIAALYHELYRHSPTAVVALNRGVAIAEATGPQAGLAALAPLADALNDYYLYHCAVGELLHRDGQTGAAIQALERAKATSINQAESRFIQSRIDELSAGA